MGAEEGFSCPWLGDDPLRLSAGLSLGFGIYMPSIELADDQAPGSLIPGLSTFTGLSRRAHTGDRVWVSLWSSYDIPRPFFLFFFLSQGDMRGVSLFLVGLQRAKEHPFKPLLCLQIFMLVPWAFPWMVP